MTAYEPWSDEQTAELRRLLGVRLDYKLAATTLNDKFGTHRSRKSCSSHIYELGGRGKHCGPKSSWPAEHDALMRKLREEGVAFSAIAAAINAQYGASYTRNSCIGRSHRFSFPTNSAGTRVMCSPAEKRFLVNKRRREKRWAENPDIEKRYGREARAKSNRTLFLARGATTTSAEYRRHVPRLPKDMTRGELRAMLAQAVQNTAAMEIAA